MTLENVTTARDSEGNVIELELLYEVINTETNTSFVVYTDHTVDENGDVTILGAEYHPDDPELILYPVASQNDREYLEAFMEEVQREESDPIGYAMERYLEGDPNVELILTPAMPMPYWMGDEDPEE